MSPALRLLPDLEAALDAVPGIRRAVVRTGPDAHPIEIHVVAGGTRPVSQLVRDVQSVAMAQFELDIDHRIVSVVQIPDEPLDDASDGYLPESQVRLARLQLARDAKRGVASNPAVRAIAESDYRHRR